MPPVQKHHQEPDIDEIVTMHDRNSPDSEAKFAVVDLTLQQYRYFGNKRSTVFLGLTTVGLGIAALILMNLNNPHLVAFLYFGHIMIWVGMLLATSHYSKKKRALKNMLLSGNKITLENLIAITCEVENEFYSVTPWDKFDWFGLIFCLLTSVSVSAIILNRFL